MIHLMLFLFMAMLLMMLCLWVEVLANSQLLVRLWVMLLIQLEILYTTVQQELVALATSLFQLRI